METAAEKQNLSQRLKKDSGLKKGKLVCESLFYLKILLLKVKTSADWFRCDII